MKTTSNLSLVNSKHPELNFKVDIVITCRWSDLEPKGLRFVNRKNGNLFSNDAEPEYITFNKEETKAYVCLQVNFYAL